MKNLDIKNKQSRSGPTLERLQKKEGKKERKKERKTKRLTNLSGKFEHCI